MNPESELDHVIHALRFVASTGCSELGKDAAVVMREHYQHLRHEAWTALNPEERLVLKRLMRGQNLIASPPGRLEPSSGKTHLSIQENILSSIRIA